LTRPRSAAADEIPTIWPRASFEQDRRRLQPGHTAEELNFNHGFVLGETVFGETDRRHDSGNVNQRVDPLEIGQDALEQGRAAS
jgi:hypothetical protein